MNKALLESLFYKGEYREILLSLISQYHVNISFCTLKRRLKQYSLQKNCAEFCLGSLRDAIMESIDGPGSSIGYCSVWHALQRKGIRVPKTLAEEIVQKLDPNGVEARKACKLRSQEYICTFFMINQCIYTFPSLFHIAYILRKIIVMKHSFTNSRKVQDFISVKFILVSIARKENLIPNPYRFPNSLGNPWF